ncbi:hypothetical protein SNE40_008287 [Patella caerulea]|uniref:HAT C-terminal dimerisation domain-containing protein n=1 Tax=Patella caerulea TaxID=87958 RepID=A0AAN8K101_PATCE
MHAILTPCHYLSYMLIPKYYPGKFTSQEEDSAMQFVNDNYKKLLFLTVKIRAQTDIFKPYLFEELVSKTSCLAWWKSILFSKKDYIDLGMLELVKTLMTAISSSASIERIFSTFGLVHSKLRNRLGVEKAGKLVFIYRMTNM